MTGRCLLLMTSAEVTKACISAWLGTAPARHTPQRIYLSCVSNKSFCKWLGKVILGGSQAACKYTLKRKKKKEEALELRRSKKVKGDGSFISFPVITTIRFSTEVVVVSLMYLCCYSFLCCLVCYRNRRWRERVCWWTGTSGRKVSDRRTSPNLINLKTLSTKIRMQTNQTVTITKTTRSLAMQTVLKHGILLYNERLERMFLAKRFDHKTNLP